MDSSENQQPAEGQERTIQGVPPHILAISEAHSTLGGQLAYSVTLAIECGNQVVTLGKMVEELQKQQREQREILDQLLQLDASPRTPPGEPVDPLKALFPDDF